MNPHALIRLWSLSIRILGPSSAVSLWLEARAWDAVTREQWERLGVAVHCSACGLSESWAVHPSHFSEPLNECTCGGTFEAKEDE